MSSYFLFKLSLYRVCAFVCVNGLSSFACTYVFMYFCVYDSFASIEQSLVRVLLCLSFSEVKRAKHLSEFVSVFLCGVEVYLYSI